MKHIRSYQLLWCIASVLALGITSYFYFHVKDLEQNGHVNQHTIKNHYCTGKGASTLEILYNKKEYYPEIQRALCWELKNNNQFKVALIYSRKFDFFYEPGSTGKYKRYIFGAVLSFLLSLLNYDQVEAWLNKYR